MLKKIIAKLIKPKIARPGDAPVIVPRPEHSISRQQLTPNVLKVLYRLNRAGYEVYLVGGAVRDLLSGRQPKDFDVATSAKPEEVKSLFSNCRLIGRRFRLAHVYFGPDIIEVATFRSGQEGSTAQSSAQSRHGMILRDNVYGTLEEDAWRRDFSINALYYNIADFSLVDFTGGLEDLERKQIRILGDPETRYREDPVRILRALRFSALMGMKIAPETATPIPRLVPLLGNVSPARLFDEMVKLFHCGAASQVWQSFERFQIHEQFFQATLKVKDTYPVTQLLEAVFKNTDERVQQGKSVTPVFIFACILWYPMLKKKEALIAEGMNPYPAILQASEAVIKEQVKIITMPHKISHAIKEIWFLQKRLEDRRKNKVSQLVVESRFRAAYDFLLLRAQVGEACKVEAEWWTEYTHANTEARHKMTETLTNSTGKRRRYYGNKNKSRSNRDT